MLMYFGSLFYKGPLGRTVRTRLPGCTDFRPEVTHEQGYFLRNELLTGESKIDKNFITYRMRHEKNFGYNFKFL